MIDAEAIANLSLSIPWNLIQFQDNGKNLVHLVPRQCPIKAMPKLLDLHD